MSQPTPPPERNALFARFLRIMRVAALFAIAVGLAAVALVVKGDWDAPLHMMIATALGAGLSVLMAAALMTLIFLSARMGHDEEAATPPEKDLS